MNLLSTNGTNMLDLVKVAYRSDRRTEDAALVLLDCVSKQLELTRGYARVLFINFTAAFNSMKFHILFCKGWLRLILWIRDFLSCHPQRVYLRVFLAVCPECYRAISTGCPQGSVLSCSFLYLQMSLLERKTSLNLSDMQTT